MKDVKTIVLEDGIEYYVVDEFNIDNNTYFYLANMEDDTDICIRKKKLIDDEDYLVMLDNEEELAKVLNVFAEKHES